MYQEFTKVNLLHVLSSNRWIYVQLAQQSLLKKVNQFSPMSSCLCQIGFIPVTFMGLLKDLGFVRTALKPEGIQH